MCSVSAVPAFSIMRAVYIFFNHRALSEWPVIGTCPTNMICRQDMIFVFKYMQILVLNKLWYNQETTHDNDSLAVIVGNL